MWTTFVRLHLRCFCARARGCASHASSSHTALSASSSSDVLGSARLWSHGAQHQVGGRSLDSDACSGNAGRCRWPAVPTSELAGKLASCSFYGALCRLRCMLCGHAGLTQVRQHSSSTEMCTSTQCTDTGTVPAWSTVPHVVRACNVRRCMWA